MAWGNGGEATLTLALALAYCRDVQTRRLIADQCPAVDQERQGKGLKREEQGEEVRKTVADGTAYTIEILLHTT